MRMRTSVCPACREQHVFDPGELSLRIATLEDRPYFCVNRPKDRLGCNWKAAGREGMCYACGLTVTTPLLEIKSNRNAFVRFEEAKRRLVAALLRMRLLPAHESAPGGALLRFHLKQDRSDNPDLIDEYVITGHVNGDITMNIRETDRVSVEATKRTFNEKYRTILGTLRHEVGHYFFIALVLHNEGRLEAFRALFGDERADYDEALRSHYASRRRQRRRSAQHVSAYAKSHPHEDWAETWAHYMHIESALAIARNIGVHGGYHRPEGDWFERVMDDWENLAAVVNALSLSLGHDPAYPFRLTGPVKEKIRFVADTIIGGGGLPFRHYLEGDGSAAAARE